MEFINEQDNLSCSIPDSIHDALEPLLKLSTKLCTRNQSTEVKREQRLSPEGIRNSAIHNLLCKPFDDSRFSNTWVAYQDWIILATAGEDLNHAIDFITTPDDRINPTRLCKSCQVTGVSTDDRVADICGRRVRACSFA